MPIQNVIQMDTHEEARTSRITGKDTFPGLPLKIRERVESTTFPPDRPLLLANSIYQLALEIEELRSRPSSVSEVTTPSAPPEERLLNIQALAAEMSTERLIITERLLLNDLQTHSIPTRKMNAHKGKNAHFVLSSHWQNYINITQPIERKDTAES